MSNLRTIAAQVLPPVVTTAIKRIQRASPYRPERVAQPTAANPKGGEILKRAWDHLDSTSKLGRDIHGIPASQRWNTFLDRMRDDIRLFKTAEEAIIFAQSRIDFDHREPVKTSAHLFQLHAETLKNEFPHFANLVDELGDSRFSRPETMLEASSKLVSNVHFFHLSYLLQCLTWVPKPELVCEIGGGYGAPARLWLLNNVHRPKTYFIIDFPESLFFAEVFLASNFDDLNLHYVGGETRLDSGKVNEHRVVLCPIHHIAALKNLSFDLVINTGSMQEMTEEWIDFWMDWLGKQSCRFFYSLNYFAQPLGFMAEGNNTWSPRLGQEWTTRLHRSNPAFVMQQTVRNFAELMAEKTTGEPLPERVALASRYEQARRHWPYGQALLECMDIVRFQPGEEIEWDLLQRMASLRTVPKEALYLAEKLAKTASESFKRTHGVKLEEIHARLKRIRAAGRENTYSF